MSLAGVPLALLAAFGLAGQAIFARFATDRGRPKDLLLIVMAINLTALVPLVLLLVPDPTVTGRGLLLFATAGLSGTMLGRAFFYAGIKRIGASRADPIRASGPVFATILAVLVLGEHVTGLRFAGVITIVVGVALVSWEGREADRLAGERTPWIGVALPLVAAMFFGLEPIFASVGFEDGTHILVGLTVKTTAALAAFFLYLLLRGDLPTIDSVRGMDIRWYLLIGASNTVFLLGYYAGLSVSEVSIVVPIMQVSPLVVIAVSAVFLKGVENVTPASSRRRA